MAHTELETLLLTITNILSRGFDRVDSPFPAVLYFKLPTDPGQKPA